MFDVSEQEAYVDPWRHFDDIFTSSLFVLWVHVSGRLNRARH